MNWRDRKLGLLLIATLAFFGCEEDVGELNVSPENNLGIFFAEYPIQDKIGQVWVGSTSSSFTGIGMAGSFNDSIFGKVEARAFGDISIRLASTDTSFLKTSILDNLEFNLRIANVIGNFEEQDIQKFSLYELTDPVENAESLTSATLLDLGEKIGESEIVLSRDSLTLFDSQRTDEELFDSNGSYIYLLKFDLDEGYKQSFLERYVNALVKGYADPDDTEDIDSISFFLDQNLRGLAIVPESENSAILSFNYTDFDNYTLELDFTTIDSNGALISRSADFLINAQKSYNYISPNENSGWTGGVFDGVNVVNNNIESENDYVYFQNGSNMFITLDLSDLPELENDASSIIIQKTELLFENVITLEPKFNIPSTLLLTITDSEDLSDGILTNSLENNILTDLPAAVSFNTDSSFYLVEPTLYMQGVIDSTIPYNQIIVGTKSDNSFNSFAVKKEDIRLRYYYTTND